MQFSGNSALFLGSFIAYIALMILIGWLASRKVSKGGTAFLTGGGHLPVFLTVCTAAATLIGTGGTMGRTGQAFSGGLACLGYAIVGPVTLLILAFVFTPMRSKNFITIGQEIQYYYGGDINVRRVAGVLTFLTEMCYIASHMTGGAKYLQFIAGYDPLLCKVICLLGFTVYVWLGGYLAVVWTDAIQLGVILIGFISIFAKVSSMINGLDEISSTFIAAGQPEALIPFGATNSTVLISAISLFVASLLGELGVSTHRHRIYTSKDAASAKKSFIITAIVAFCFVLIPIYLGMATRVIATKAGVADALLANRDMTFAYLCTEVLGGGMGLLLMIAGLSATLSSGDSDTMAATTILIKDVIPSIKGKTIPESEIKGFSRKALLVSLTIAFLLTLLANDFIGFLNNVFGALMPALAIATLVGRFSKRVTPAAGISCMIGGTFFGFCYLLIQPLKAAISSTFGGPAIPVALLSLVIIVVVSMMTKRPDLSEDQILDIVLADAKME